MALIQALIAMVMKSVGRLLNTAFGWATIMLFGKVPANRQIFLSIVAFGSIAWLGALIGIALPRAATFALTFVTLPSWVDKGWIRIAMLVAAVVIPIVVGAISTFVLSSRRQAKGNPGVLQSVVIGGFRATTAIALTLLMLFPAAIIQKLTTLARRWQSQHVPVIVDPNDYQEMVGEIERALNRDGLGVKQTPASALVRWPTRVLATIAGGTMQSMVADQLVTLRAPALEVVLHPSDLVISGKSSDVVHARATISEQLAFSKAHLTWDKEANQIEDELGEIWDQLKRGADRDVDRTVAIARLQNVEQGMKKITVPFEEWEVLFREKLLVERGLLQVMAGITDQPKEPAQASAEHRGVQAVANRTPALAGNRPLRVVGFALLAMLAWLGFRTPEGREIVSKKGLVPLGRDIMKV